MINLQDAVKIINAEVQKLPASSVTLAQAVGCALAEDIVAPIDVPAFPSSAMDGVALRVSDLKDDGPWRMPVQTTISAGDLCEKPLLPGHVAKIMTGAPLIEGADTVVPVEYVQFEAGQAIIKDRPAKGDHVRPYGDDIEVGQNLYSKGTALNPVDIGVLASIGLTEVKVIPRPTIGILSTGSELVEPGVDLKPGQIYDSNKAVLSALLAFDGHLLRSLSRAEANERPVPDMPKLLSRAFDEFLKNHDLVITTGGVSMGDFDFIPQEIAKLGGEIIFHKVKIKPGKPILMARFGRGWFIGLPGNPVSVIVGYHIFVRRVIFGLMGREFWPRNAMATLADDLRVTGNRHYVAGAWLETKGEDVIAHPAVRQMSNRLSSIKGINGLIFVEGGTRTISRNSKVYVEWLF